MPKHYASKRNHSRMSAEMKRGEMYASQEQARSLRKHDSHMIAEDPNQPCLLPNNVIDKYWDKNTYKGPTGIVDLYAGAQKRLMEDREELKKETELGNYW